MKQELFDQKKTHLMCVDTTLLRFGSSLRGIPQVVFILLDILREPPFLGKTRFLAYPDVAEKFLRPFGIMDADIVIVPSVPWLGKWDRFHCFFSTWRFRKAVKGCNLLVHPEARSMTRLPITQAVIWYDFLQIEGRWKPRLKPSRYLFTLYKYRLAMRRAWGITISQHTRQEALRNFPWADPSRLTPIWLGVRKGLKPKKTPVAKPLHLPLRCVYVGSLEERKNVFAMLNRLKDIFGELPFILNLAGKISEDERKRAERILTESSLGEKVCIRGRLSDEELVELMEQSEVTLFPSLGEGFGLPVAEGMMHGHVVFAFKNTSIPEVGGAAIVLAEDDDFTAWGRELQKLVEDSEACLTLRDKAIKRAEFYSQENMKTRFRNHFQKLLYEGAPKAQ